MKKALRKESTGPLPMHRSSRFDRILSEARKYKLRLIVANQFVEQLTDELRAAIFGNVGFLTSFRVGNRDARILNSGVESRSSSFSDAMISVSKERTSVV